MLTFGEFIHAMTTTKDKLSKCANLMITIKDIQSDILSSPSHDLRNDYDARSNELFFMANSIKDDLRVNSNREDISKFTTLILKYRDDLMNYKRICKTALKQIVSNRAANLILIAISLITFTASRNGSG